MANRPFCACSATMMVGWLNLHRSSRPRRVVPDWRVGSTDRVLKPSSRRFLSEGDGQEASWFGWRTRLVLDLEVAPVPVGGPERLRVFPAPEVWRRIPSWGGVGCGRFGDATTVLRAVRQSGGLEKLRWVDHSAAHERPTSDKGVSGFGPQLRPHNAHSVMPMLCRIATSPGARDRLSVHRGPAMAPMSSWHSANAICRGIATRINGLRNSLVSTVTGARAEMTVHDMHPSDLPQSS